VKEEDVVLSVIERLEALGLDYMLVGSYASNAWGRPRSSYDADIVVRLTSADTDRFLQAFTDGYVLERESLRRDLDQGRMFNLIPHSGVFKVDIIPVRKTAYAREEFSRRRPVQALGRSLWMAAPEDTILYKLVWFRSGDEMSGRQLEDARDVWALQRGTLDEGYLTRWADELGVRDLLERIRTATGN
jgi:hypothetical protein